jgi:hypothetical protein
MAAHAPTPAPGNRTLGIVAESHSDYIGFDPGHLARGGANGINWPFKR